MHMVQLLMNILYILLLYTFGNRDDLIKALKKATLQFRCIHHTFVKGGDNINILTVVLQGPVIVEVIEKRRCVFGTVDCIFVNLISSS